MLELDSKIRNWPRNHGNDPYKVGLEKIASALRRYLPNVEVSIGYNEFCSPSIPEVMEQVIQRGATRILVAPSMLTPGGVHSEVDIPRSLERIRKNHPEVEIAYLWPFDDDQVAKLLSSQIQKTVAGRLADGS